ncbi:MAG TPA: nucleoside triphosphatase YtkD [Pseudogracilibacillus sp.]|nr:nucleoside triphosphatase YtkD [Pseudogracilibacillus sp.]
MVYTFTDYYQNEVKLSFEDQPFSDEPKHVWVICRYGDKWLLTAHRSRGLEFPGGKVEKGETAIDAAHREVMEETGALVDKLHYVAQYFVDGKGGQIIKNVYFAEIESLTEREHFYETDGPVLIEAIPRNIKQDKGYSFMMKDEVLQETIQYIEEHLLKSE